jgi:hypothetical protein
MMQSVERSGDDERMGARCSRENMNRVKIVRRGERGKRGVGFVLIEEDDDAMPLDEERRRS